MNRRGLSLPLASLLLLLPACEGPTERPVRIGILADCNGFTAPFYKVTLAGAELPMLRRGGSLAGEDPSAGVNGVSVGGHPVELVFGCAGFATDGILEIRRLVEDESVDIVIGPNVIPNTLALIDYAKRHPQTAFVIATMEQAAGLDFGPNVYRFTADAMQISAGLGDYAFERLGWRTADTIAFPDLWQWGLSAGFVGEFCSLGGSVHDRIWLDVVPEDVRGVLRAVPLEGTDGFFLSVDTGGTTKFLRRYMKLDPHLSHHIVSAAFGSAPVLLDPTMVHEFGDALLGIVTATFVPLDASRPAWNAYVDEFRSRFPDLERRASSYYHLFDIDYDNAMEAVMRALGSVDGDLSDGGTSFREALARVRLDAPNGPIRLDDRLQAIVPVYVSRVEKDEQGDLVYRTIRVIDSVDQTFGGTVDIRSPEPDRTQPPCRSGNPPPWAVAT